MGSMLSSIFTGTAVIAQGTVRRFVAGIDGCKMALIVRTDLDTSKGKMCAQCSHACLLAYKAASSSSSEAHGHALASWEAFGSTKVTLRAGSEKELMDLHAEAKRLGLVAEYVRDAGRTQIPMGTITVLAIGPDDTTLVNSVTGHLKLL